MGGAEKRENDMENDMDARVNVICLKWGARYPAHYVNRLYAGVKRNLSRPFRFVCFTDSADGLDEGIEAQPIPPPPEGLPAGKRWPTVYTKLALFRDGCGDLEGPTLFLDIDQMITGPMDRFFDFNPGGFCIIHNWIERRKLIFRRRPDIGNSSCFRFEAGKSNRVWEAFRDNLETAYDKRRFTTEQAFMTHAVGLENITWWPDGWVVSFKRGCHRPFPFNLFKPPKKTPAGASILCFHGDPSPEEAIAGFTEHHGKKVRIHQRTLPAPWLDALWKNGTR